MLSLLSTIRIRLPRARPILRTLLLLTLGTLGASACAVLASTPGVYPVEQPPPGILEEISLEEGLSAVALSAEGTRAATAVVQPKNAHKNVSTIRLHAPGADPPLSLELSGGIRDLLFSPDGQALFALLHISAKRRPGDVYLVRIDLQSWKSRRELPLPPSAQGLAYLSAGNAILIACANEIRSVLLPDLRSGPLYRLLGVNASVAVLDETRILVGRDDGIAVVDLTDPQGEEEMPVRLSIDSMDPVRQVAVSGDGTRVLARLAAHGVVPVRLGSPASFGAAEGGPGLLPSRPWSRGEPAGHAPAAEAPPVPEELDVETAVEAQAPAPPPEPVEGVSVAAPTPPPTPPPPPPVSPPADVEPGAVPASAQIAGVIIGPGAADVSSVVILGPDNILREAQRVQPGADGRWHAAGLDAGRYRIQLSGSKGAVVVADPAFRVVQVESGLASLELDFRVLESP